MYIYMYVYIYTGLTASSAKHTDEVGLWCVLYLHVGVNLCVHARARSTSAGRSAPG